MIEILFTLFIIYLFACYAGIHKPNKPPVFKHENEDENEWK